MLQPAEDESHCIYVETETQRSELTCQIHIAKRQNQDLKVNYLIKTSAAPYTLWHFCPFYSSVHAHAYVCVIYSLIHVNFLQNFYLSSKENNQNNLKDRFWTHGISYHLLKLSIDNWLIVPEIIADQLLIIYVSRKNGPNFNYIF